MGVSGCGWCWWMSVGVWMVLVSVSGCGGVGGHQWCMYLYICTLVHDVSLV